MDWSDVRSQGPGRVTNDEFGRLTRNLNALLVDRQAQIEALQKALAEATATRDAAEAASHAKSVFLANIGHEIRTPLNGVLGMAQAMAAGDLSAGQRQRIEIVRESGEALLKILTDIADLSEIETDRPDLESEPSELEVAPPPEQPAGTPDAEIEFSQLRVLAAEDNETNQLVLTAILGAIGVTPHIVSDGRQAVEAWSRGDFDLILMDIQMPNVDGIAATREIRAQERARNRGRTRIVALTANAMSHQVAEYQAAGMDGLVTKPISLDKLYAVLAEAALHCTDTARAA